MVFVGSEKYTRFYGKTATITEKYGLLREKYGLGTG